MLKFGPPDTDEAERWLRDAGRHLKSAKESLNSSRPAKAMDDCQAAVEMAVKALFPLAGAQAPTKHGVGKMLHPLTSGVKGKKWAVDEFKQGASRVGWLNEVSEKVQVLPRQLLSILQASEIPDRDPFSNAVDSWRIQQIAGWYLDQRSAGSRRNECGFGSASGSPSCSTAPAAVLDRHRC